MRERRFPHATDENDTTTIAATPPASAHRDGENHHARVRLMRAAICGSTRAHISRPNPSGASTAGVASINASTARISRSSAPHISHDERCDSRSARSAAVALAVVVEQQFLVAHMPACRCGSCHGHASTNGASAVRILRTARKMLCLVALVLRPSSEPISSIESPSIWRSVNAARSISVNRDIVSVTRV